MLNFPIDMAQVIRRMQVGWWFLMACSQAGTPTLELSVSPTSVARGNPSTIKATARSASGSLGTGRVRFESDIGSLVTPEFVTIDEFGTAEIEFVCDPLADPACATSARATITGRWLVEAVAIQGSTTVRLSEPVASGDAGLPALFGCTSSGRYSTADAGRCDVRDGGCSTVEFGSRVSDAIGLCNSLVLLAETTDQRLRVVDVTRYLGRDGGLRTVASFPLPASPGAIDVDPVAEVSYATLRDAQGPLAELARVSLKTGQVTTYALPERGLDVAVGRGGLVYITFSGPSGSGVAALEGMTGTIRARLTRFSSPAFIAADPTVDAVVGVNTGISPATIERLVPNGATFDSVRARGDLGSNGTGIAISPDGAHLAVAVGSGNMSYDIFDLTPADLSSTGRVWVTGAYPSAASFSSDSRLFITSNGRELFVFDVLPSQLRVAFGGLNSCAGAVTTGATRNGTVAFALTNCAAGASFSFASLVPR